MRVTKYPIAPEVLSDDYILIDSDENGTRRFPANDFMPNDIQVNQATASEAGIVKLYTGTGTNTDGAINQSAMTTLLNNKAGTNTGTTSSAGLTKLYSTTGNNTDGTMTQSAITNAIQSGGVNLFYDSGVVSANISYDSGEYFFPWKSWTSSSNFNATEHRMMLSFRLDFYNPYVNVNYPVRIIPNLPANIDFSSSTSSRSYISIYHAAGGPLQKNVYLINFGIGMEKSSSTRQYRFFIRKTFSVTSVTGSEANTLNTSSSRIERVRIICWEI